MSVNPNPNPLPQAGGETAYLNRQWAVSLISACLAMGSDHFFVAPGSRCTPLTLAIAELPSAQTLQHFDERGLAFACLGYAEASGRAGVFVCTSGTAAANAFPAVIEASQRHVPMLLLTADRPPELRAAGANQTIDQRHLYGGYTRWFHELPCADDASDPREAAHAIYRALDRHHRGPVQVNCMFREPWTDRLDERANLLTVPLPPAPPQDLVADSADLTSIGRGVSPRGGATVVLVGDCHSDEAAAGRSLAERWGCPLLADITSGLRTSAYDLALSSGALPRPETVVHLGGRIVSKRLLQWLSASTPRQWLHVWPYADRYDPEQCVTDRIVADIPAWTQAAKLQSPVPSPFVDSWQRVECVARQMALELGRASALTEPAIASALAQRLPDDHGLWLGNSMPVREMDTFGFWEPGRRVRVGAHRGASGIDGHIASAIGFAWGLKKATTVVLGDLSLLHDLNGLALIQQSTVPLIVVVINNNGGGIFHFLPIADETPHFEKYFGTPHGRDFRHAAEMFAVPYESARTLEQLCRLHQEYLDAGRSVLIEVTTDREANVEVHRQIEQRLRKAVGITGADGNAEP